jgi:uncharacterized protein YegL
MQEIPVGGSQTKLREVQEAAKNFISQNLSKGQMAVVAFSDTSETISPLTAEPTNLFDAIDRLPLGGGTNMDAGLRNAAEVLTAVPGDDRKIFLFTDGLPNDQAAARSAAIQIKERTDRPIEIVAVGTGDADRVFLEALSGRAAISASSGQFGNAFQQAAQVIYRSSSISSTRFTAASPLRLIFQAASWAALLSMGIGLALIMAQNLYLGRKWLAASQAFWSVPGSVVAGAGAGAVGQFLFLGVASGEGAGVALHLIEAGGRVVTWALLGGGVGFGMSFIVPNLPSLRAIIGGVVGGALGAVAFVLVGGIVADWLGRLLGGGFLGSCIGAMVAWVEAAYRKVWLEIRYGPHEARRVSLGAEPVSVGGDQKQCTVYAAGAPAVALRYWMQDKAILCQDVATERTVTARPGDRRQVGAVTVMVCGSGAGAGSSGPEPEPREAALKKAEGGAVHLLRLGNGGKLRLSQGTRLTEQDLPGLHSVPPGGTVAEVVAHPQDPTVLGLRNDSQVAWRVRTGGGDHIEVKPGKSLRLRAGTQVSFGTLEGTVET